MPERIIIVGNSGFARECAVIAGECAKLDPSLSLGGFLSFEGYQADLRDFSSLFLGNDDDYAFGPDDLAVIGIGDPGLRRKAYAKLKGKGVRLHTLIHPHTHIAPTAELGEGCIVTSDCFISCDARIGPANVFNGAVRVGHDVRMGGCNFVGPVAQILGAAHIGDDNSIGTLAVLMAHCRIGNGNIIAPLSAVYKGCKDNAYMAGSPALKMGGTRGRKSGQDGEAP